MTWTYTLEYPEYTLDFTDRAETISAAEMQEIVAGLTANMPELKIRDYFHVKPRILWDAEHLVRARSAERGTLAVLASRWWDDDAIRFLNIATLLIGTDFRRSPLIRRMWAVLFGRLRSMGQGFPDLIALKTYNPSSFTAMKVFSRVPEVAMYPRIDAGQDPIFGSLAVEVAGMLSPGQPFQPETGVILSGGAGVPEDFYPSLPQTSNRAVFDYFSRVMSPADRMLCLLSIPTEEAKTRICKAFGVHD